MSERAGEPGRDGESGPSDTQTFVGLVTVTEEQARNVQELAGVWGDVRETLDRFGGRMVDTYSLLGGYDFLVIYEAPDRGAALKFALTLERYGLDVETLAAIPIEEFGSLVDDV